jgi:hypothetical protein
MFEIPHLHSTISKCIIISISELCHFLIFEIPHFQSITISKCIIISILEICQFVATSPLLIYSSSHVFILSGVIAHVGEGLQDDVA